MAKCSHGARGHARPEWGRGSVGNLNRICAAIRIGLKLPVPLLLVATCMSGVAAAQTTTESEVQAASSAPEESASTQKTPTSNSEVNTLETVVVTGIRAALNKAIATKRNADVIVDSIASEDIGKFPDSNIAEALQRIPGVTISTNDQGEGEEITIRGFGGTDFNKILLNGRILPSFGFDTVSADLLSGTDVYKSSTAKQQDGGIGGVVDLRTLRPFDVPGRKVVISTKESYESMSGHTAPSVFGLYSQSFEKWGFLFSLSHQERNVRTEKAEINTWLPDQDLELAGISGVYVPQQYTQTVTSSETRRTGMTGALEFRPTDNLRLTLDALYSTYNPNTEGYELSHYITVDNITSATVGANNTVTSLTTNENGHTDQVRSSNHTQETLKAVGFNADWMSSDGSLELNLDLSSASNESNGVGSQGNTYAVVGYQNAVTLSNIGSSGLPQISTAGVEDLGIPADTYTDASLAKAHFFAYNAGNITKDRIHEGKLDGAWHLDDVFDGGAWLPKTLKFGTYGSARKKTSRGYSNDATCTYCGYWQDIPDDLLSVYNAGSDFLDGNAYTNSWLTFDPDELAAYLASVSGTDLYAVEAGNESKVTEDVAAAYVQADFEGEVLGRPWSANLGLRYVRTKISSTGYSQVLTDLLDVEGDPTYYNSVYADDGAYTRVTSKNTYKNWLPSLNFKIEWRDDLVTRFAASKTLTRPNLDDLSPVISYDTLRPNNLVASSGNPDLTPYVSTNLDLSLEWYYQPGGYASLALFTKDVDDYVVYSYADEEFAVGNSSGDFPDGTATFRVKRPRNAKTASVSGVEIAFQHNFSYLPAPFDGLGLTANATFVDSPDTMSAGDTDTDTERVALEGVGDSYNLTVFYEKGPFGLRAAYTYRDDYLEDAFYGSQNEPMYIKGYGKLDVQASYRFGKHVKLVVEGNNVTDQPIEAYGRYENQFIRWISSGSRYYVGLRVDF